MLQHPIVRLVPCLLAVFFGLRGEIRNPEAPRGETRLVYALAIRDAAGGDVEVSVLIENPERSEVELVLPCWAPGRYLRDDFAALVCDEKARLEGGREIAIERVGSHVWRLDTGGDSVLFSYRIHAGRASVGTSLVEARGALLQPASLLPYLRGAREKPVAIHLDGPEGWRFAAALERVEGGDGYHFAAPSWDALAVTPILGGSFAERIVETDDLRVDLAVLSGDGALAGRAALVVQSLLPAARELFGPPAAKKATLILHATGGDARTGERAKKGLGLVVLGANDGAELESRLAAATVGLFLGDDLGPALAELGDMTDLTVRDDLWVAPAFQRYLGLQLLGRAGLLEEEALLAALGDILERAEQEPGARRMTLVSAARRMALRRADDPRGLPDDQADDWIDPVLRGEVAALLLDLELRALSAGGIGLADALGDLGRRGSFSLADLRRAIEGRGGRAAGALLDDLLNETTMPAFREIAGRAGFRLAAAASGSGLGCELEGDRVVAVRPDSAAARAGLQARDRILRLGGQAVAADSGERIAAMRPGQRTTITVERRGGILTLPLTVESARSSGWRLVPTEDEMAERTRAGFLGRELGE